MKAALAGILVGAATFVIASAGSMSTTQGHGPQLAAYQPGPSANSQSFTEVASTFVLAPQRIAWNAEASAVYVQGLENIIRFNAADGSTEELISLAPVEMVLDISANGLVAVMRDFNNVVLIDTHDGSERTLVEGASISSASFSPDGSVLALVLNDGSLLQTWDVGTGVLTAEYTSPSLAEKAYSVTFAPSGERLTWYSVLGGQAIHLGTGELGPFVAFSAPIYDVQMCTDDALVVANDGALITLWDTNTGTIVHRNENLQAYSNSCSLESPQLAISAETQVGLLDLPALSVSEWLPLEALDAELSPDGRNLAAVELDGTISIWQR